MHQIFLGKTGPVAALFAVSLLAACQSLGVAQVFTPTATEYDGAWIGDMAVTFRKPECRITRGGLRVKIEGGKMDGVARFTSNASEVSGLIAEDGSLKYAFLRGRFEKDDVDLIGTFGEREATGTWANELCRGEWTLRKAR